MLDGDEIKGYQNSKSLLLKANSQVLLPSNNKPIPKKPTKKPPIIRRPIITALPPPIKPLTHDQKEKLSIHINALPLEKLTRVISIIQMDKRANILNNQQKQDEEVVELDLNSLGVGTCLKLWEYVMGVKERGDGYVPRFAMMDSSEEEESSSDDE